MGIFWDVVCKPLVDVFRSPQGEEVGAQESSSQVVEKKAISESAEGHLSDHYSTDLPARVLESIQTGVLRYKYRGIRLAKSPFDLALYLDLLQQLKPRTVIEIGTLEGGSALWFLDMLSVLEISAQVVSVDNRSVPKVEHDRITFLSGDARQLGDTLTPTILSALEKPWLVVEDSAHLFDSCLAVLRFFDRHLFPGDYIVIEDGIVREMPGEHYRSYEDGPSRAIEAFLAERAPSYEVDTRLCNFFGRNFTYNPSAYIRRIS